LAIQVDFGINLDSEEVKDFMSLGVFIFKRRILEHHSL